MHRPHSWCSCAHRSKTEFSGRKAPPFFVRIYRPTVCNQEVGGSYEHFFPHRPRADHFPVRQCRPAVCAAAVSAAADRFRCAVRRHHRAGHATCSGRNADRRRTGRPLPQDPPDGAAGSGDHRYFGCSRCWVAASAAAPASSDRAGQSVRHSGALPARGTRLPASAAERHPAAARQRGHPAGGYRGRTSRPLAGCCSAGALRHPESAGALRQLLCTFRRNRALPVHPTGCPIGHKALRPFSVGRPAGKCAVPHRAGCGAAISRRHGGCKPAGSPCPHRGGSGAGGTDFAEK